MPTPKTDKNSLVIYRRILRFDELLSAGAYPSLQELIDDDDGGSRTTVFRTLDFMKTFLHAPIVFDRAHGGYCYSEKTFRLPAVWTTEQEQFALVLMQGLSSKLKGTPLYESASRILEYLQNNTIKNPNDWEFSVNPVAHEDSGLDWVKEHYVFLNGSGSEVEKSTWETLERCMKAKHQADFEYYYEKNKEWVKIQFNPYQIVNSNGRWYVWGYDINIKQNRLFLFDLIRNVKIVPREFKLPKDFDFRNYTNGVFGAFVGKTEYRFIAEFTGWAVPYIKRTTWGKNQKIENIGSGTGKEVRLSFDGTEILPFLNMLLSYGSCAKPVEPPELVKMWKDEVKKMNKLTAV